MNDLSKYADEDIINIISSDAEAELRKRGYAYGWYKIDSYVGAIYIFVNPAFPGLVKIGYADDVEKRMKQLNSNTGLPDPFHCYALYRVRKRLEDLQLHEMIDTLDSSLRHAKNREFYELDYKKAFKILSAIAQINGDDAQLVKNPFNDDYFNQDKNASILKDNGPKVIHKITKSIALKEEEDINAKRKQSERLTFESIGVPIGAELVFRKNPVITCKVVDTENKVSYKGNVYPISRLAKILLNVKAAQGGEYFTYKGEKLTDIRKRLGK